MLLYLQNNIWTILIALTSGAMLFWSFFGNRLRGIKDIDHIAATQLINHKNALVLDVREQGEYDAGHILNSKLISLGKLHERIGELEKYREKPILVVCRSGMRSASACALLGKQGFAQAYNLEGGVMAWQKASLPLEK
ncbi:MAG: rhodanese-like domain-containing protein [Nitrosomonadales bacterium]|nr:rhodanese-like domain-containing protein [Nitrosomonadales bacterium]